MRKIEKIFMKASLYTVLMLAFFYIFALITKFTAAYIDFGIFAVILLFGIIISITDLIFDSPKIKRGIQVLTHYFVLLIAFCVIFIIIGKISLKSPSAVFAAIVLFTLLYGIMFGVVYAIKRLINKGDDYIDSKSSKKTAKKSTYKSLYK